MDATRTRTVIELLSRSPLWAIQPEYLAAMLLNVTKPQYAPVVGGATFSTWEAAKPSMLGNKTSKVAVIPIQGVLSNDGPSWLGTSYKSIADAAEHAASDPAVKRVVLAVNSPGGEVSGLPETANLITQLSKVKPVSAMVDGDSASAAYWLTSQANDITLTPSGEVGSVGVRMMHMDISKMLDDYGVKVTELHSGQYKTEWSPYKPLTDEAKADMQTRLDSIHRDFISAVATGRANRASAEMQDARYGEGRMFSASIALSSGLVDKVQSPRDFYRAITPADDPAPTAPPVGLPRRARLEVERHKL
jgi:signal peptide peptidase SppA